MRCRHREVLAPVHWGWWGTVSFDRGHRLPRRGQFVRSAPPIPPPRTSSSTATRESTARSGITLLRPQSRACSLGDLGGGQAVLFEQGVGRAALAELVAEVDVADRDRVRARRRSWPRRCPGRRGPGAPRRRPGRRSPRRPPRGRPRSIGLTVCMSRTRAWIPSLGQRLGGVERGGDHQAVGDDGHVACRRGAGWPCRS